MTAAVALTLVVALIIYEVRPDVASAAELLDRSVRLEQTNEQNPNWVLHRTLNLEELDYPSGVVLSHRRIEVWRSPAKQVRLRRLFDENNQLVAEERIGADGIAKVYHAFRDGKSGVGEASPVGNPLARSNVWMLEPSASSFASLIGDPKTAHVEKRRNTYSIGYDRGRSAAQSSSPLLLKGTLNLDKPSLHAVEEKLVVQDGIVTREFRISERALLRLPANTVDPEALEPTLSNLGFETPQPEVHTKENDAIARQRQGALIGLQVEALYRLSEIGPELENQVRVERMQDGRVVIHGTVDSPERKEEVLSALSPMFSSRVVKTDVRTVWEALEAQSKDHAEPIIAQEVEVTNNSIPVSSELARYFAEQWNQRSHPGGRDAQQEWVQSQIRELSSTVLAQSHRSYLHALALRNLASELPPGEINSLDSIRRAQWEALIQSHAAAIGIEARTIRKELEPIFFAGLFEQVDGMAENIVGSDLDLKFERAAQVLFKNISENHEVILSAFTVSNKNSALAISETKRLRQSLTNLEALATRIGSSQKY